MWISERLPAGFTPTAIVVGEEDYATPIAMAQGLHKAIFGSTLTVISTGRHLDAGAMS
jgi:3-oxoadipate enol-lactonase